MNNRTFAITAYSKEATLTLGDDRQGKAIFTVTNSTERAIRGRLRVKPLDTTKAEWLNVVGEGERDFPPNGTQQVEVTIAVPTKVEEGKYTFRLEAISVVSPRDDFTEGPNFAIEVPPIRIIVPPWWRQWLWVIVVAAVVLIAGGVVAWLLLRPKMVEVPKVETMTAAAAKEEIEAKKLKVKIDLQEKCGATKEEVVAQNPAKGTQVKEGSEISLTVSTPVKPLKLENYVGKKIDDVKKEMERKCISIEDKRIGDDSKPEGTILVQDLKKDTEVKEGGKIALTIAVPLVPFEMLQVTSKPYMEAEKALKDKGLIVIGNDRIDTSKPNMQVIDQSIPAGKLVKAGETVTVTFVYTPVAVPHGLGWKWDQYQNQLSQTGLVLGEVRGDCATPITRTEPPFLTNIPKGSVVNVYLAGDHNRSCSRLFLSGAIFSATKINGAMIRVAPSLSK